jgi:hypothetical protein
MLDLEDFLEPERLMEPLWDFDRLLEPDLSDLRSELEPLDLLFAYG